MKRGDQTLQRFLEFLRTDPYLSVCYTTEALWITQRWDFRRRLLPYWLLAGCRQTEAPSIPALSFNTHTHTKQSGVGWPVSRHARAQPWDFFFLFSFEFYILEGVVSFGTDTQPKNGSVRACRRPVTLRRTTGAWPLGPALYFDPLPRYLNIFFFFSFGELSFYFYFFHLSQKKKTETAKSTKKTTGNRDKVNP